VKKRAVYQEELLDCVANRASVRVWGQSALNVVEEEGVELLDVLLLVVQSQQLDELAGVRGLLKRNVMSIHPKSDREQKT
jgi:hypothetical protein